MLIIFRLLVLDNEVVHCVWVFFFCFKWYIANRDKPVLHLTIIPPKSSDVYKVAITALHFSSSILIKDPPHVVKRFEKYDHGKKASLRRVCARFRSPSGGVVRAALQRGEVWDVAGVV